MTLKITATAARALARKFGRAINRGDKAQVTPFMNALKTKGTGTMTTSQRQEFRGMLDKVVGKQTRRQVTGTAKVTKKPSRKPKAAAVGGGGRPVDPPFTDLDKINSLVANNSMNQLQRRLRVAKTSSQKKLLRAAIKDKKKLADAPRRYKWGESDIPDPYKESIAAYEKANPPRFSGRPMHRKKK